MEGSIGLLPDALLNNEEPEQNTGYNSSARCIVNREDQAGITRKETIGASVWFGLVCVTDESVAYRYDGLAARSLRLWTTPSLKKQQIAKAGTHEKGIGGHDCLAGQ
ncbi:hypothetical protein [Chlorobaculum tepidum]|uniref:hypothetical protein n=1 Tax=Chlorobaculum tepidum TaxID=1097 RepID=UPI0013E8D98B|nr:hypothetical protein [Chlorobaculum tepidum]